VSVDHAWVYPALLGAIENLGKLAKGEETK
jgi:hypothetical protein